MFGDLIEHVERRVYVINEVETLLESMTWKQIAEALYQILDDIDTLDDITREDFKAFNTKTMEMQLKKNQYMYSPDGYGIVPTVTIQEDLVSHARYELMQAGLFDEDSDYDGMLAEAVLELMDCLAKQGHSGCSAAMSIDLFSRLAKYETLTEITDDPEEWMNVTEHAGGFESYPRLKDCKGLWQSRRSPGLFSYDAGKTYYNIDEETFTRTDEGYGTETPMHTSALSKRKQQKVEVDQHG